MLRFALSVSIVSALATAALAQRPKAPNACVHRDRNESSRFLREVGVSAKALTFCTGNDCWSQDLATGAFSSVPTAHPIAGDAMPYGVPTSDPRGTASETEVSFCPSGPASCTRFQYKFAGPPADAPRTIMNADGTIGAVLYTGNPMEGPPSEVYVYDLASKKLVHRYPWKGGPISLFAKSFLIGTSLYNVVGKKLGTVAQSSIDPLAIPSTNLAVLADAQTKKVVLVDVVTGKAKPALKLDVKEVSDLKLAASADGTRAFVILDNPFEGEVFTIDVAADKMLGHGRPAVCAADTWR